VSIGEEAWKVTVERVNIVPMLDRLEIEFDDVRATLSWLEASGDDNFLRLASSMSWFCFARGHLREGIAWLDRALFQSDGESTAVRARALLSAGMLTHYFGDDTQAVPFLERSLKLYRELNDSWGASASLTMLGIVAEDTGNYDRAIEHLSESLAFSRAAHEPLVVALSLYHLGVASWGQGDGERAEALLVEAIAAQREIGDIAGYADSMGYLGLIVNEHGDRERSGALFKESLTLHLKLGSQEDIAASLANFAVFAATAGQPTVATRLLSKATAMRGDIGNPFKLPEREVYDRATATVHATLGSSAFKEAWVKGSALPLAEAVVQALDVNTIVATGARSERAALPSFGLTTRELEVLQLIATGLTDRAIGNALYISARTAQKHVATILAKLGVNTRTAATTTALRSGIVKIDGEPPAPPTPLI
jgi:ATP/maltotriose-dependent transcriptional regulator MalT